MTGESRIEQTVVRDPDVLSRRTLDGILLLPPRSPEVLLISGAGCAVWELLAEPATAGELAQELAEVYHRSVSDVANDVSRVLQQLADAGALTSAGDPGSTAVVSGVVDLNEPSADQDLPPPAEL